MPSSDVEIPAGNLEQLNRLLAARAKAYEGVDFGGVGVGRGGGGGRSGSGEGGGGCAAGVIKRRRCQSLGQLIVLGWGMERRTDRTRPPAANDPAIPPAPAPPSAASELDGAATEGFAGSTAGFLPLPRSSLTQTSRRAFAGSSCSDKKGTLASRTGEESFQ